MQHAKPEHIRLVKTIALAGYLGLLGLMLIWQLLCNAHSEFSLLFRVGLWIVPLLLPLPGMLKGNPFTFAWANFILMWYFLHGFTMVYISAEQRNMAIIEILFTSMAFVGCTLYARWQGRALGLTLPKLKKGQ